MKTGLAILLLLFALSCSSQTLPDNFNIGNYVEVFNKDSIKIYYNCTGTIVDKKCASYYRVGKIDPLSINVTGEFRDYDPEGNLCFKATMLNNNLNGSAKYYYKNGRTKEEGKYSKNLRNGIWAYYYPNGDIEKILNHATVEPLVVAAYTPKKEPIVINGDGHLKTQFSKYMQCNYFEAWGKILNGKKDGKWVFSNPNATRPIATETYKEGVFIRGQASNSEYSDNPKIELTNFYANENLSLLENSLGCPGDNFFLWEYNSNSLYKSFYPELLENIAKYDSTAKDQWLIVGIRVDKKNTLSAINVCSSINDTRIENHIYNVLSKMNKWQTAVVNSKRIESDIFFTILIANNEIFIPTEYRYRNN